MGTFNFSKDTGLLTDKFYILQDSDIQDWNISEIKNLISGTKKVFQDTLKMDFWNGLYDITVDFYLEEEMGYYQDLKLIPHALFHLEGREQTYMSYDTKDYENLYDIYKEIEEEMAYSGDNMDFKYYDSRKFNKNDLENFRVKLELAVENMTNKKTKELAEYTEVYRGHGGWTGLYK